MRVMKGPAQASTKGMSKKEREAHRRIAGDMLYAINMGECTPGQVLNDLQKEHGKSRTRTIILQMLEAGSRWLEAALFYCNPINWFIMLLSAMNSMVVKQLVRDLAAEMGLKPGAQVVFVS